VLDTVAWVVFLGVGPVLWVSGMRLFVHSGLSRSKKIGWVLLLVAVGAAIGWFLPLPAIRNRFLALLIALPLLAIADVMLARSDRGFSFWFHACAFEVCTVFGSATMTRLAVELLKPSP
jgi:hypothetical protein